MMKIKRFGCAVLTLAILIGILMLPSCSKMGGRDKARSGAGTDGSTALTTVAATTASARKGEFAVRVGETEIQPLRCFNWTEDCDPQSGGVTYRCGLGISDVFYEGNQEEIAAIPRVCAGGEISILNAGSNWTLSGISVYRYEDGELIREEIDVGEDISRLNELGVGEWYVSLTYIKQGLYVERAGRYNRSSDSYLFQFVVE